MRNLTGKELVETQGGGIIQDTLIAAAKAVGAAVADALDSLAEPNA